MELLVLHDFLLEPSELFDLVGRVVIVGGEKELLQRDITAANVLKLLA